MTAMTALKQACQDPGFLLALALLTFSLTVLALVGIERLHAHLKR